MQDTESFATGAKLDIDMQFEENAGVRITFNLTDAAGRCRHGATGRDTAPFLGGVGQAELPRSPR
jgi:hypothetical protein